MTPSISLLQAQSYPTIPSTGSPAQSGSAQPTSDSSLSEVRSSLTELAKSSPKTPRKEIALFDQIEKLINSLARLIEAFAKLRSLLRSDPEVPTVIPDESSSTGEEGGIETPATDSTNTSIETPETTDEALPEDPLEPEQDAIPTSGDHTTDQPSTPLGSLLTKSGQFLWKPDSDKDNKLAILLPSNMTGRVKSVSILSPDGKKVLQRGRFSGVGNGSREHYRFTKPGKAFPDKSIVLIKLEDGTSRHVKIADSSRRTTR